MFSLPFDEIAHCAGCAEDAGFSSVWVYEYLRNPFMLLAGGAAATNRVNVATGIAVASSRSPFAMANEAADLDEISGGRLILGIGAGIGAIVEAFHSTSAQDPVERMREYIDAVRASWHYLAGTVPDLKYMGERYSLLTPTGFSLSRPLARARIPVYLGALGPKMMQLAGEKADGMVTYAADPTFVKTQIAPHVMTGAKRVGRDPATLDVASMLICSISRDRAEAIRRARVQMGLYLAMPTSDRIARHYHFEREQAEIRSAIEQYGPSVVEKVTPDAVVEALTIAGTPDEVRRQVKERAAMGHVILHTPYMSPITAEESSDSFKWILETFCK